MYGSIQSGWKLQQTPMAEQLMRGYRARRLVSHWCDLRDNFKHLTKAQFHI